MGQQMGGSSLCTWTHAPGICCSWLSIPRHCGHFWKVQVLKSGNSVREPPAGSMFWDAGTCPRWAGISGAPVLSWCGALLWLGLGWSSDGHIGLLLQTYSQLAHPIQQAKALGLQFHSRILDIDNVDVSDFPGDWVDPGIGKIC